MPYVSTGRSSQRSKTETRLQVLINEIASLRNEVQKISESLISDRLKSVEKAIAINHLEIYAAQTEEFINETVDRCLRQECGKRVQCEERFRSSIKEALNVNTVSLEKTFDRIYEELSRIDKALEKASGKPCETCYGELQKVLYQQKENMERISRVDKKGEEMDSGLDVQRLIGEILKPLSHPARLTILDSLYGGRTSFAELSEKTGMKGGHLIFHLGQLLEAGLMMQDGRKGDYVITSRGVEIIVKLSAL